MARAKKIYRQSVPKGERGCVYVGWGGWRESQTDRLTGRQRVEGRKRREGKTERDR